jgi:hypothetical protein
MVTTSDFESENTGSTPVAAAIYGRSPGMCILPSMQELNHLKASFLHRVWLRAEMKRAYAMLSDGWE